MKIVMVSASDIEGGAARAAYRQHRAFINENLDSLMLVQNKSIDDNSVLGPNSAAERYYLKIRPKLDTIPVRFYKNRLRVLFSPAFLPFSRIVKKINEINPDIVHLQWINQGMIRIEDILKIKVPIVWTLQDMWAFTGGCHYCENCLSYERNCGNCMILGSNKKKDLSRSVFKRKQNTFAKMNNLTIVCTSRWLENCAKASCLLSNKKITCLPNSLDTNLFKPFDKEKARELWGLPKNIKLVLFGAIEAISDNRKGFKELSEALKKIKGKDIEVVVFGSSKPKSLPDFGFKTHYLGYLHDDISIVTLYSACDVMVVPSLQEAFGQTASESLACGTPVVAFGNTGLSDIISHKLNGYLVAPFDTSELAEGIEWILRNTHYKKLSENARQMAATTFDSKIVARKYINLFNNLIH